MGVGAVCVSRGAPSPARCSSSLVLVGDGLFVCMGLRSVVDASVHDLESIGELAEDAEQVAIVAAAADAAADVAADVAAVSTAAAIAVALPAGDHYVLSRWLHVMPC